jgi:hypothetical protein
VTGPPTPATKPKVIKYRNMSAKAQRRRAIKATITRCAREPSNSSARAISPMII